MNGETSSNTSLWDACLRGDWTLEQVPPHERRPLAVSAHAVTMSQQPVPPVDLSHLLSGLSEGWSNSRIAVEMGITEPTVSRRVARLVNWMGVRRGTFPLISRGLRRLSRPITPAVSVVFELARHGTWSQSEYEVMQLAIAGLSAIEIGRLRGTSQNTVRKQRRSAATKVGKADRLDVARSIRFTTQLLIDSDPSSHAAYLTEHTTLPSALHL